MIAHKDHHDDTPASIPRNQCRRITAVAELLDISISSVRRLIRAGQLEAIRIGASVRVTEASLEALLMAGRRSSGNADNEHFDAIGRLRDSQGSEKWEIT